MDFHPHVMICFSLLMLTYLSTTDSFTNVAHVAFPKSLGSCLHIRSPICESTIVPGSLTSYRCRGRSVCLGMAIDSFVSRISRVGKFLSGENTITEESIDTSLRDVKRILLDGDVNLQVTTTFINRVKEKVIGAKINFLSTTVEEQFIAILASELVSTMGRNDFETLVTRRSDGRSKVFLLCGLQGAGKTTTAGKLAKWIEKQALNSNVTTSKTLLVAADVYRPAAAEQLQTLGRALGFDVFTQDSRGATPVQICRSAMKKASAEGYEIVIIDSAGRQAIDARMMDELKQIKGAVLPDEVLLVVDAMTGQEAAYLTTKFDESIGLTGAILTKFDGDARVGAALSIRGVSGKPIRFLGLGEGLDDLELFDPARVASRILGLGDVEALMEKAQSVVDAKRAAEISDDLRRGQFTFNALAQNAQWLRGLGGLSNIIQLIPGMAGKVSDDKLFEGEKYLRRSEAIISAMSPEERKDPSMIAKQGGFTAQRRKEIAGKAGCEVEEVICHT